MHVRSRRLRSMHAAVLLTLVFAAFAAAGAGTAEAKSKPKAKALTTVGCGFETGALQFSSLARLAPSSTARTVGKGREKNTKHISGDTEIPASQLPATSSSFEVTIPVWFHVVAAAKTKPKGWLSDSQVAEQMNVLNLAFAGVYGGADTGFRFRLEGVTRTINADWFAQETFAQEVEMKSALKRGGSTTLNIYSTSGGGFLGWAYLPHIVVYQQYQVLDGVVIHHGSLPGGSVKNFNLGHTATHEVGHYLGLEHTFEFGCSGHGDYVRDTPYEATPTSGCPIGKDTCPAEGVDPIHNYMDYSFDKCYSEFTAGQATREQQQWLHWRVKHGYK